MASFAILLLMAKNRSLETRVGARFAIVFFVHNLISLSLSLRRLVNNRMERGFGNSNDFFDSSMGLLYLFWTIYGAITMNGLRRRRFEI